MERLPATDIPGWLHTSLQGEAIAQGGVPTNDILKDTHTPAVISPEHAPLHEISDTELFRVSQGHGRSYEIGPNANRNANRLGKVALWRDEFDNAYSSYSLKGNNFTHSTLMESSTAPSGYIPMGLLESDALLRVVRSSRLLREAGASTEWVNRVFEPQELLYKGEAVSQDEYKRRLLIDTANTRGLEEMVKIAEAIDPMTFFITGRSMEINDRLADFAYDNPEEARKRLQRIFAIYNATHVDDENFKHLQPAREADRNRFFRKVYPTLLGTNLAKLHNANLVHTFPTLSNVTILGGIIDLDSVRGEPLEMGDAPVTVSDRANDLATLTDYDDPSLELRSLYGRLNRLGVVSKPWHFIEAQYELLEQYEKARKPLPRKQDRTIENMAIKAANWQFNGGPVYQQYIALAKTESRKTLHVIWDTLMDLVDTTFSEEHMSKDAKLAIDAQLTKLSDTINPGESIIPTKELLEPARTYYPLNPEFILVSEREKYPKLVAELDESIELTKLKNAIPDTKARHRILAAIMTAASRPVSKKALEEFDQKEIEEEIVKVINEEIDALLEKQKPSDWQVFAQLIDGFDIVKDKVPNSRIFLNQQAIHGFENIELQSLVESAHKAGISIRASDRNQSTVIRRYIYPPETLTARTTFTDGSGSKLMRLIIPELERETAAVLYETPSPTPASYIAMLCEDKESGQNVLYVDSENAKALDALIQLYG